MTLHELRTYLNNILDITEKGNQLSPSDLNNLLNAHYLSYFRIKVKEYTSRKNNNSGNKSELFYDMLNSLLASSNITITAGSGTLPGTFGAWDNAYGTYGSVVKPIELVISEEKTLRVHDILTPSPEIYPICELIGNAITVYPNNITPLTVVYYTKPSQPIYDYYLNASGREVYMTEGQTSVSVPSGGRTSAGVAGPVTVNSLTIELDMPSDLHDDFANYLLSVMGIRIGDLNISQYAEVKKQTL